MPSYCWRRFRGPHLTLLALALICASLGTALSSPTPQTITLKQGTGGYSGCTDTFLDQYAPNYNYGNSDEEFWVQKRTSHDRTALIKFDLTGQLPSGACIKSATLRLYQFETYNFATGDWLDVGVYRCMPNWQEGTGGDEGGLEVGACWVYRTCNPYVGWSTAGARGSNSDRHDTLEDTERCTEVNGWHEWDVTPACQYWQNNPTKNYGLVLDWTAIGGHSIGGINFRCSEWGSERPELVVIYVIPEAESAVDINMSDLSLNYWNTDPTITFSNSGGLLLCSGATSDTAWGADGSATNYTMNSSFEASIKVKLQQGIVGVNQGQVGFGLFEPSTSNYVRINAIGYSAQYYEISGLCTATGNGERHDGAAYWASYWDDHYPVSPPSGAVRFFSQTSENETTTYLTYKIRYDKTNGMFYVYVNDVLVTYYSNVNMSNWRIGIEHENNYSGVPTTVWYDLLDFTPPTPNPMTWSVQPHATGTGQIEMTASTATDAENPPVWYNFTETTGHPGGNSVEQAGAPYADSGLSANTQYGYKVRARDSYSPPNYTGYSSEVLKYTLMPAPTGINVSGITATSADMSATDTFPNLTLGQSGIYFDADPDASGGINAWIQTTTDTVTLTPNTQYTFKIKARNGDATETTWAQTVRRTLAAVPVSMPYGPVTRTAIQANWGANGNPSGTEYYCEEMVTGKHTDWAATNSWALLKLDPDKQYHFRVKARNADLAETDWCDLGLVRTTLTVGQIKSRFGPLDPVHLGYKIVTASFPALNLFFVEDPPAFGWRDGSSGIGVHWNGGLLIREGDIVDVDGVLKLNDAPYDQELLVNAFIVRPAGHMLLQKPYFCIGRDDGGETFGSQSGVCNDITADPPVTRAGLNQIGQYVTATGLLRDGGLGGIHYFWIDDGSGINDGAEIGIRVDLTGIGGSMVLPPLPQYFVVSGIMRCVMLAGADGNKHNMRVLWPRMPSDIRQYILPMTP